MPEVKKIEINSTHIEVFCKKKHDEDACTRVCVLIMDGFVQYFLLINNRLVQMPVRCHGSLNFISQCTYVIHNLLQKFKINEGYHNILKHHNTNPIARQYCCAWFQVLDLLVTLLRQVPHLCSGSS
jgi:hypothetical protein